MNELHTAPTRRCDENYINKYRKTNVQDSSLTTELQHIYIYTYLMLVVFNVPSTTRSFRDSTPIYCPLRRTWSLVFTPYPPGIEPRAVAWQSITQPLHHTDILHILHTYFIVWQSQIDKINNIWLNSHYPWHCSTLWLLLSYRVWNINLPIIAHYPYCKYYLTKSK